uniref:MGH1-like glycoside hydrolase domain-containing protein n=1 Tax=Sulfitobacter sp. TaxID=1903071 RepID=UPI00272D07A3
MHNDNKRKEECEYFKTLKYISSSSFSPLFASIPDQERAQILINTLNERFGGEDKYLCASFDTTSEQFNPKKYWRGPIWI